MCLAFVAFGRFGRFVEIHAPACHAAPFGEAQVARHGGPQWLSS